MSMMTIMVLMTDWSPEDLETRQTAWTIQDGYARLPVEACWLGLDVSWTVWEIAVN